MLDQVIKQFLFFTQLSFCVFTQLTFLCKVIDQVRETISLFFTQLSLMFKMADQLGDISLFHFIEFDVQDGRRVRGQEKNAHSK